MAKIIPLTKLLDDAKVSTSHRHALLVRAVGTRQRVGDSRRCHHMARAQRTGLQQHDAFLWRAVTSVDDAALAT